MKKIFLFLLLITFSTQTLNAQKIDVYKRPERSERSRDYDAIHYRLKLFFDLKNKTFKGENRITLTPLRDGFNRCILDAEEFKVTEVLNQRYLPLKFKQTDRKLIVNLLRTYSYGDTLFFTVKYNGKDPKAGLFFNEETPENPSLVSTISWPENAHHWFPCYDYPNDKVTQEVIVTVKSEYRVLSNGKLINVTEDKENKTKTYHWLQDLPHSTYLFMLAIGPYEVIRDSLGSTPINYWVYKKDVENARFIFRNTPKMMDFYNNLFGFKYPWAKYDQVTIPGQGGGAEATSATVLDQNVIHDKKAEQDFSWETVIAHELSHQWWGDLITLRTWAHTWMNESFATYSDYLYTRYAKGEDEAAVALLGKKNAYLREAHTKYMHPIVFNRYNKPSDVFNRHTYQKGASVLHMLRFVLGDESFFRTLQYFLHKYAFQVVDTYDFMNAVKKVTGQNLDWFFNQWVFKPGHPIFDISYSWNNKTKKVNLRVIQTQDTTKGIPVYKTPVIIEVVTPGEKFCRKVWIKKKREEFEFSVNEKPLMVRFDKGNFLLKEWSFKKGIDELIYQLKNDDVIGKMWAASELLRFKDEYNAMNSLIEIAYNDPFWAVRRSAVETIAKIKDKKYIDFFKAKCGDNNSKVRTSALRALGDFKNPDLIKFFEERFEKDSSYLAQAEALRSIGKCGDKSVIPFLKQASTMKSPRNVIKRAAEWALKKIEEK